jgi:hypothetical protein
MRIVGGAVVATVGRHLVRLVRRTDDAPVTLRLVAEAASRQVDLLGVRFSFERAAMAVGAVAAG